MADPLVTAHEGVKILVTEKGKFYASVAGRTIEHRTLAGLRKAITTAIAREQLAVDALAIPDPDSWHSGEAVQLPNRVEVVSLPEHTSSFYGQATTKTGLTVQAKTLVLFTPEIWDACERFHARQQALHAEWTEFRHQILNDHALTDERLKAAQEAKNKEAPDHG